MISPITTVLYTDLALQHSKIRDELLGAVAKVIDDARFILGEPVTAFEQEFATCCRVHHAVGVSSGTSALVLALKVLGIGPGDEVITAPNSFVASVACIRLAGATPVLVDVADDYNIDPTRIEVAITPQTRAILPVHLTGRPCRMDAIMEIARRHQLYVVEDAAQAVCAEAQGRRVGSFGSIGCFSLHPLKTLNACGDAGVLTTNEAAFAEELRIRRNIGLRARDDCVMWSDNSRLDALQAAILLVKMRYVEQWTEARRLNAKFYQRRLSQIASVVVPSDREDERAAYHTFVIQADQRDRLREHMTKRGIGTAVHYPVPIHLCAAGRELGYRLGSFPVAERQAERIVSLPIHQDLTEAQLSAVCDAIEEFYAN